MVGCITKSMDMSLSNSQETVKDRKAWCVAVRGVTKNQTGLSNKTILPKLTYGVNTIIISGDFL